MLLRGLRELRDHEATAPDDLVATVMGVIDGGATVRASSRNTAAVRIAGGTAVAIAAAAAIAGIRHRRAA
jgi:hypothetical protein